MFVQSQNVSTKPSFIPACDQINHTQNDITLISTFLCTGESVTFENRPQHGLEGIPAGRIRCVGFPSSLKTALSQKS